MKFTCEACGRTETSEEEWTEEMRKEEYKKNFPNDPDMKEPLAIVCDDCYKKMGLK